MRLWIGLYLPQLPLEVFCPNWTGDNASVVLEQERVLAVSPAAQRFVELALSAYDAEDLNGARLYLSLAQVHEPTNDALVRAIQDVARQRAHGPS
jgi:protein ImuB